MNWAQKKTVPLLSSSHFHLLAWPYDKVNQSWWGGRQATNPEGVAGLLVVHQISSSCLSATATGDPRVPCLSTLPNKAPRTNYFHVVPVSEGWPQLSGSSGKGICCQDSWPEFGLWDPHGGREPKPASCVPTSTRAMVKGHIPHIYKIKINDMKRSIAEFTATA